MFCRQIVTGLGMILALQGYIWAQSIETTHNRGNWFASKRVAPAVQGQLRVLLADLSATTDWVVGVRADDVDQPVVSVSEVRFDSLETPLRPLSRHISALLDWPANRTQIQPGSVEVSGIAEANGSLLVYLRVPKGTRVKIDTNRGTILSATPATSLLVQNGLVLPEEVHNLASLVLQLQFPQRSTASRSGPEVVPLSSGYHIATLRGLSTHLVSKKPEIRLADKGAWALLRLKVDEVGNVIEVVRVDGDQTLLTACEQAAREWKFRPFVINGTRVSVVGLVPFRVTQDGTVTSSVLEQQK